MSRTTAVMLQDRLNDIERNICDGIDFRQELNEAYALADELQAENDKLRELVRNALTALDNNCAKCAYRDGCTILQDCKCRAPERLREDMRDLGVEVER